MWRQRWLIVGATRKRWMSIFAKRMAESLFFFFSSRGRHTRFDCDWSSDVCSSDLTQLIVPAAGALVYASLATHSPSWPRTILVARWIFGVCSVDFGLAHLTDVKDLAVYVPKWMPLGGDLRTIVTGICFVLAGLAILSGILDVLAARLLAL